MKMGMKTLNIHVIKMGIKAVSGQLFYCSEFAFPFPVNTSLRCVSHIYDRLWFH